MPKEEKRRITELFTEAKVPDPDINKHYVLGEETNFGRVESISFRRDGHRTLGSFNMPCYVVSYHNSTVQTVIPYHAVLECVTDVDRQVDEDVGRVPELPDEQEGV